MTLQFTVRLCHVVTERISVRVQLLSAFEKFDIAHDSVQAYDSSSANISWRGFFRRDNKLFSSGGLPTEAMTRSAKAITGVTNFIAILRLLNFSY